jgi:hypothetical protein
MEKAIVGLISPTYNTLKINGKGFNAKDAKKHKDQRF